MLDIHILALTGLAGLVIIALVIHLIFFVRLYEKVNRIDKSDSYLHLLVGRIEVEAGRHAGKLLRDSDETLFSGDEWRES